MNYNNDNRMPRDDIDASPLDELFADGDLPPRRPISRDAYRAVMSDADRDESFGCVDKTFKQPVLEDVPLAMVYSPVQTWDKLYDIDTGFTRGTIFESLDFPFMCPSAVCRSRAKNNR